MKKNRIIQILLGIIVAGFGLMIFFNNVDLGHLKKELSKTNLFKLLIISSFSVIAIWFRSLRWKFLIPDTKDGTKNDLFKITLVAFMVNNILPARAGEAVRVILLWKRNHHSILSSTSSVIVERIIDSWTFALFFSIGTIVLPQTQHLQKYGYIAGIFSVAFVLFMLLYSVFTKTIQNISSKLLVFVPKKIKPKIIKFATQIVATLNWVFDFRKVVVVFILSVLTTGSYILMIALMINNGFVNSLFSGMVVLGYTVIGAAIPLAPGYVGTLHALMLQGLVAVGIKSDPARAIAILYHASCYIPVTIAGLIVFFKLNLNFSDMIKAKKHLKEKTLEH